MEELLKPASIIRKPKPDPELELVATSVIQHHSNSNIETSSTTTTNPKLGPPTSPEDALSALKSQPDYDTLMTILRFLSHHKPQNSSFPTIKLPSPLTAQLVQVLVSDVVPNYWTLLLESVHDAKNSGLKLLLYCLSSVTGVNAILVRLRALIQDAKADGGDKGKKIEISMTLGILVDLLNRLLHGDGWLSEAWQVATSREDGPARVRPRVQEILTAFGSGRMVSLAAEAEAIVKGNGTGKDVEGSWVADSLQYIQWLGRNIVAFLESEAAAKDTKFASDVFGKGLRLGHADALTKQLLSSLVLQKGADPKKFGMLLDGLPQTEQRKVLFSVLKFFSSDYLNRLGRCEGDNSKALVSAVAGALSFIVNGMSSGRKHLVEWLTSSSAAGVGEEVGIRRAVLAVVAQEKEDICTVVEKSINQFGDQLYIKHSPMLQQEAHAQVLLISAGYVHRKVAVKLAMLLRSGVWMNTISNRLKASNLRARFIGMIVGEALSALVDKEDKRLNFHMEETDQEEGQWYKGLTKVMDDTGPLDPLSQPLSQTTPKKPFKTSKPAQKPTAPISGSKPLIIEELSDEGEDDDIIPYAKPDSDPEDSDDDPTLIRRDKPKAPVYIRDLIKYLRDTDSYDRQKLALETAPTLIRRKAGYGTELSEHAEELGSLLVGLHDRYDLENFNELRAQGMIALIIAKPEMMGPWFARTFFEGDYSINQRASVLVVLGLAARELAGLETSDYASAAAFPSKKLPEKVEQLYLTQPSTTAAAKLPSPSSLKPLPPNALDTIATSLTNDFLAPLAARAADAATGPDILKLSTFTSRLRDKAKQKTTSRPRVRSIPNTTASLLSHYFFSPLVARFQAALHSAPARGSSIRGQRASLLWHPQLLALYLQTLALVVHAAGPSTLSLPAMTADLWRLLLSTRVRACAVGDLAVTRAVLFGFMALLDVNEERMRDVCGELGREVVEAQEWVAGVFDGLRGGDEGGEEEEVKMLAAGVLVRLREGIERWQLVLVGDLIGFG